jgi:hypothetical protein
MSDPITELKRKVAELERRIPVPHVPAPHGDYVAVQMAADRLHQAYGDSAGATRPLIGESLDQYRRRLMQPWKRYSAAWKDVDLQPFAGAALEQVEKQVYADAMSEASNPINFQPGVLTEYFDTDRTGRRITRFRGDPGACWDQFKLPIRRVVGITTG